MYPVRKIASVVVAVSFWGVLLVDVILNYKPLPIVLLSQATVSIAILLIGIHRMPATASAVFYATEAAFLAGAGALAGEGSSIGIAVAALKGLQYVIDNMKEREETAVYLPGYNDLL